MVEERERKIRTSQIISPSGVGAVIDLSGRSYIGEDISKWGSPFPKEQIQLDRLARKLGVRNFRAPPASPERDWQRSRKLPYYYFPRWIAESISYATFLRNTA